MEINSVIYTFCICLKTRLSSYPALSSMSIDTGKPALFLIMTNSCLRIIQAETKTVRCGESVNNATISYT